MYLPKVGQRSLSTPWTLHRTMFFAYLPSFFSSHSLTFSGVRFIERCGVKQVLTTGKTGTLNVRVNGVDTDLGHMDCRIFVNCSGQVSEIVRKRVKVQCLKTEIGDPLEEVGEGRGSSQCMRYCYVVLILTKALCLKLCSYATNSKFLLRIT